MGTILNALQDVAAYVFGGTPSGASATPIAFADSLLGKVVNAITAQGNELLLVFAILGLIGLGVGIYKRIVS